MIGGLNVFETCKYIQLSSIEIIKANLRWRFHMIKADFKTNRDPLYQLDFFNSHLIQYPVEVSSVHASTEFILSSFQFSVRFSQISLQGLIVITLLNDGPIILKQRIFDSTKLILNKSELSQVAIVLTRL